MPFHPKLHFVPVYLYQYCTYYLCPVLHTAISSFATGAGSSIRSIYECTSHPADTSRQTRAYPFHTLLRRLEDLPTRYQALYPWYMTEYKAAICIYSKLRNLAVLSCCHGIAIIRVLCDSGLLHFSPWARVHYSSTRRLSLHGSVA